jgi:hypothetical protein
MIPIRASLVMGRVAVTGADADLLVESFVVVDCCVPVFMYVVSIYVSIYVAMYQFIYVSMDESMYLCIMYLCIYVSCMYVCMHVGT